MTAGRQDAPRGGQLFHAGGEVSGLANGRVVHVQIIANGAHHHLAAIEADAHLHCESLRAPHLLGIALHGSLHGQRCIAGPHGVVLMRHGRAKERHNAIAQDLVHRAFVAMHGRHHHVQGRVEELPRLLRVTISEEFHRALEIGKQHGHLFALPFQGTAGHENLFGEIGRRVGERRGRCCLCGRYGNQRRGPRRTGPDQDPTVLIHRQALAIDEFLLQVLQRHLVELELPLQGAIGQTTPLTQQGDHLI